MLLILQDHLRSGGTERQTLAIAEGLQRQGVETTVAIFRRGGALDSEAAKGPFAVRYLNQGPLKTNWFAPGLRRLVRELAPTHLIAMGRMANCHLGLLCLLQKPNTKLIATCRTGRSIPFLQRVALKRADRIVCNSHDAVVRLKRLHNIDRGSACSVIYNGCLRDFDTHIPTFAPAAKNPPLIHLCSVSMFRPQKQQLRLIRLCSRLPDSLNWKLTLAGDGPTLAACQAETARLNLGHRVEFTGLLKDPRSLYDAADIAVHVSDAESLPNFLVEAQTAGLPVVAYDVDGVRETFDHPNSGILIPHGDEPAFLAALTSLALDPAPRARMSAAARQFARARFSLPAQTAAYRALLTLPAQ